MKSDLLLITKAIFHAAVNTANGTPETCYSYHSNKAHRCVQMTFNERTGCLLCTQINPKTGKLVRWAIPSANIISMTFGENDGEAEAD